MVSVKCTGAALSRLTGLLQPPYFLMSLCSYVCVYSPFLRFSIYVPLLLFKRKESLT